MSVVTTLLVAVLPMLADGTPTGADRLHTPFEAELARADETQRDVIAAFPAYDHARIARAVDTLQHRAGTDAARPDDDYFIAQGKLELLLIRRFFDTDAKDKMPPALAALDADQLSDEALDFAKKNVEQHPDDSDARRVVGELWSTKIRGMASGMTNGPKAKEGVEKAIELDPKNALAILCQGRMHYHNPAFAGGDKEKALEEFRRVANDVDDFRAHLYLARIYRDRDMNAQARFWVKKALRAAPENPEAKFLQDDVAAREEAARRKS